MEVMATFSSAEGPANSLELICNRIGQLCILVNTATRHVVRTSSEFKNSFGMLLSTKQNKNASLELLFSEDDLPQIQQLIKGTQQICAAYLRNSDSDMLWTAKIEASVALLIGWRMDRASNVARVKSPPGKTSDRLVGKKRTHSRPKSSKKIRGPGKKVSGVMKFLTKPSGKDRKSGKMTSKRAPSMMGNEMGAESRDDGQPEVGSESQGTHSSQNDSSEENENVHKGTIITEREHEIADEARKAQKNQFTRNAHDIRNPLNSVIGYCHLLKQSTLDEDQMEYVTTISEASKNMLKIVNHLLESTREPPVEFAIRPCVESAIEAVAVQKMKDSINLGMWLSSYVPINIVGVPRKLRQIMINLLNNALKFTPKGAVTIKIWLNKKMSPHISSAYKMFHSELLKTCDLTDRSIAELVLEVKDTGIGMSPSETKKLFQPYSQANDKTKALHGGSGLGLFAVENFCKEMGGKCWVRSRKGEGSIFYATFRIGIKAINRNEIKNSVPWVTGKKFLVFQRWEFDRKAIADSLHVYGAQVKVASTREELEKELATDSYHALIMESSAKNQDNGIYIREIRALAACEHLPIIAVQDFRSKSLRTVYVRASTFNREKREITERARFTSVFYIFASVDGKTDPVRWFVFVLVRSFCR
mmetsp:Transcript_23407/g.32668  ORF Transcript_23407/g.32668 Transcript_23407/m.32668 type:complete len:647 (-) Transcript_23407:1372-3312(-)